MWLSFLSVLKYVFLQLVSITYPCTRLELIVTARFNLCTGRLMMVVTLALSVFLVWFYMLGPCFCGLAIIAHAALRKESVHGVGTVKTNELKNRAKDMIANAKARQKSG